MRQRACGSLTDVVLRAVQSAVDRLQTNDQVLSLTDQLNLGVRMIELDTHWVQVRSPTSRPCCAAFPWSAVLHQALYAIGVLI
jgi:hypothetical protein